MQELSRVEVHMSEDFFPGMGDSFYTCEILEEGPETCLCRIVGDPDKTLFNAPRNRFYPIRGSKKQDTWSVGSHVEVGYRIGSPLEPLGREVRVVFVLFFKKEIRVLACRRDGTKGTAYSSCTMGRTL